MAQVEVKLQMVEAGLQESLVQAAGIREKMPEVLGTVEVVNIAVGSAAQVVQGKEVVRHRAVGRRVIRTLAS
ncbi:hypothetical protein M7I_1693 [Glarea lozoyensis 74030]|uniref:Uncharacterized protein n=1 Tax=Glarea lozoyensis (strain ATCC 74030 / MF5533) TaxID=1104152 RepID=H0EGS3_GLAL7|nr:hypothetical protein M7I_1693 [Glarea lozoyensis 74030]